MSNVGAATRTTRLQWMVLLTVILGTFLGRLDQTIVNLAIPKIMGNFGITVTAAGWIATAYILANAVFVPIWGKLGDTVGRKKVYLIGFIIFIFGSALAGFAWNLTSLIFFRVIQAIAGSADYPTAMAIIAVTFRSQKARAQALGLWSASFAAAAVFGPLIGGPLIDTFGWRSVFLVNIPVGLLGLGMAIHYIEESVSDTKTHIFDWWGATLLGIALSAVVLVLNQGPTWGWLAWQSILSYVTAIVSFTIFIQIEKTHPEPIVDFKFFKIKPFVYTLLNSFVVFMGMMGVIFLIPIFAQTFLGYDATQTGYLFIPMAVILMIAASIGGRLTGKIEDRVIIVGGTLIAALGLSLFIFLDSRSSAWAIILPMSIMSFGLGLGMAQRTNIVASVVPKEEIGVASSILALVRNIAGAFGIALFSTVLQNQTKKKLLEISKNSAIHTTTIIGHTIGIALMELKAQVSAYSYVFVLAAFLVGIGAFIGLGIKLTKEQME